MAHVAGRVEQAALDAGQDMPDGHAPDRGVAAA
jgi:hypothetical protein